MNVESLQSFISLRVRYLAFGLDQAREQFKDRIELGSLEATNVSLFASSVRKTLHQATLEKSSSISQETLATYHALAGADLLLSFQDWPELWSSALSKHCSADKILEFFSNHLSLQLKDLKAKFSHRKGTVMQRSKKTSCIL